MIVIPLSKQGKNKGKYATVVDDCDDWALDFNWSASKTRVLYATRHDKETGSTKLLHREIMQRILGHPLEKGQTVDHRNHDGLDNRRENLRLATRTENQANRRTQSNSLSGYKGVRKKGERYQALIYIDRKPRYLGSFATPEEANAAYLAKAQELYGEFANNGELSRRTSHFEIGQRVRLKEDFTIKAGDSFKFWAVSYKFQKGDVGTVLMTFESNPEYVRVDLHSIEWVIESHRLEAVE